MKNSVPSIFSVTNVTRFLWGAALFTMPVTSFRYFPFLGEGTYVRPLSLYPVALLLLILFIQVTRGKASLPRPGTLMPLLGFVLIAFAATGLGLLLARAGVPWAEIERLARELLHDVGTMLGQSALRFGGCESVGIALNAGNRRLR